MFVRAFLHLARHCGGKPAKARPRAHAVVILAGAIIALFASHAAMAQQPPQETHRPVLLVLGDSLTAGYGLAEDQGFTVQLASALGARGLDVTVRNAGVSGDTSAGGLARLDWTLAEGGIDAAIVELGANDALRGLPPEETEKNLDRILTGLTARGVKVLLAGMQAPPNLGADYAQRFAAIYPRLAAHHHVLLYPFFLDGAAAEPALNQADGMHPNGDGVAIIVQRILPMVVQLLDQADTRPATAATP